MNTLYFTKLAANPVGGLVAFLPMILMIAVLYFLMIRPQQKKLPTTAPRSCLKRPPSAPSTPSTRTPSTMTTMTMTTTSNA